MLSNHQSFCEISTMHIRNELSMMLILHCQDDDLHARVIPVGSEFTWSFRLAERTLFWCDLAVQDKRVHIDVVDVDKYYPFHWVVKDDGIYGNDPRCDPVYYPWKKY
ncbi:hypothetical protein LINPERPRIM_LOCUS26323 [Linum perenne]